MHCPSACSFYLLVIWYVFKMSLLFNQCISYSASDADLHCSHAAAVMPECLNYNCVYILNICINVEYRL